jgi:pimeloyl-ACP methyl ester carboxylesterase
MTTELQAQDRFVSLGGLRFHYRDWGDPTAPPLVLLHAYTSHARSWDTVARGLADRFRVLALDQRGHGETEWASDYHELRLVDDLAAFVDALELETFSVVGFSIGSYAACSYALLNPGRVRRLVLAECFAEDPSVVQSPTEGTEHIRALRALSAEFHGPAETVAEEAAAAYRPLAPYAAEDELRRWMLGGLIQKEDGRWTWRSDPVLRQPGPPQRLNSTADIFAARLAGVTNPTLLVVGAESFMAESAEQIAKANSGKRLVVLPRTGHWVPLDNPSEFLEVAGRFLTEE